MSAGSSSRAIVTSLCVFLLVELGAASISSTARAVGWEPGTFEEALSKAAKSDRFLLIDFGAGWCGPCHEMEAKVWSHDHVRNSLAGGYVLLKRDGEVAEGKKLAERYHVLGFPTLLIVDASGQEVDRLIGFVPVQDLVWELQQFRAGRGTLAELEKRLAAAPADEALRFEVATRHAMRGDARAAEELRAVIDADADGKKGRAPKALLTLGKYVQLRGAKDYARAVETLRELETRFPSTEAGQEAGYQLGLALHLAGKSAEARLELDRWLERAPRDSSRYNSYAWLGVKLGFDRARALEVAKKGLEMNPRDDGLWDTLAELHALAGENAEAGDAEKKALALKPGDAYYEAQLKKLGGTP